MPHNPNEHLDHTVLELIERNPGGAVPATPAYQDALKRLYAAHQVYADADHINGHVTARSLAQAPSYCAQNLEELVAGRIGPEALEPNGSIFDRYLQALPADRRAKAEGRRLAVAGRLVHHRAKNASAAVHDKLHSLFLVPGAGPHPGLPGNYLYGSLYETGLDGSPWAVNVHDNDDGLSVFEASNLEVALAKLQEILASAPFTMQELEAFGFRQR